MGEQGVATFAPAIAIVVARTDEINANVRPPRMITSARLSPRTAVPQGTASVPHQRKNHRLLRIHLLHPLTFLIDSRFKQNSYPWTVKNSSTP
mmetsp:Transcript_17396/g.28417  ORF Transcript_17396/g.28417 Transcript_17396/m.28417 type:complete len:93 (-) Transcript_17396:1297-1575(-)